MSTPNAVLAYQVLDTIDANPDQWDQADWAAMSKCGAAYCFAGWAVVLSGRKLVWESRSRTFAQAEFVLDDRYGVGQQWIGEAAREALGIDDSAALFSGGNTREDLGRLVAEIFGPRPDYGTGCSCDWLGVGTPEHAPSALCKRPDGDASC